MHRRVVPLMCFLTACTPPDQPDVDVERSPIFYGEPDREHVGVVRLVGSTGLCSGAFIARRVVLTAHHCLDGTQGSRWEVMSGEEQPLSLLVTGREVVLPEDVSSSTAEDIALLITDGDAPVEPYFPAIDLIDDVVDSEVTVVGYGLDENGNDDYRQHGEMSVAAVDPLALLIVGRTWPGSGDSGGPVFDERGHIVGVVSRGWDGGAVIPRVDQHRWFLDPILRQEGGCVPGDPEICDGIDNDCDGEVDPECSQLGEACTDSDECSEGECLEVVDEGICTNPCDPGIEGQCWDGAYCVEESCDEGHCRPGEPGERALFEDCSDDRDCESLLCRDLGRDALQCTRRCTVDGLDCGADQICLGEVGSCGLCVSGEQTTAPRGLGELCEGDDECREGLSCLHDPPHRHCSTGCNDGSCPDAMHCRREIEMCFRGMLGQVGSPCLVDDDCEDGVCHRSAAGVSFCTEECGPGQSCDRGFSCDFEAEVCIPWDGVLGQLCGPDADDLECFEGDCVTLDGEARCATPCGSFCPSGFECRKLDDEEICWPVATPAPDEGCDCHVARLGSHDRTSFALFLLLAGVYLLREARERKMSRKTKELVG